jgi:hypothetical protein
MKRRCTIFFLCSCGTGADSIKSTPGHVVLNQCFASGWISESRSALRCAQGVKHGCTIFLARMGTVRNPERARRDT